MSEKEREFPVIPFEVALFPEEKEYKGIANFRRNEEEEEQEELAFVKENKKF